ncbi:MAG: ABC transporter ATP-binding protein [Elusimicrobiota bacterium]
MLKLRNVTKKFKNIVACEDIDFTVEDGEFFVLVGPSGCGKTTILRLIAGLEDPDDGQIIIKWKDKTEQGPRQRNTAMVFQNYALYPHMTVKKNLEFPLKMHKVVESKRKEIVKETAELLKIDDIMYKKASELSGGEKQRVAVGRALVRKPTVFLLDEPLSNLDAKLRQHLRIELARIQKEMNITTLYVTHDQEEAMTLADRIAVIKDGKIQQTGVPAKIYSDPENLFVAKFIGSPDINIFNAEVEAGALTILGREIEMPVIPNFTQKKVLAAVRPEDLELTVREDSWKVDIDIKETSGPDVVLHLKTGDTTIRIRESKENFDKFVSTYDTFDKDNQINFDLDIEKVLFFDPETKERLEY